MYRVGPLGRLNVADGCSTPLADKELKEFKEQGKNGIVQGSLYFHQARLIELLNCAEEIKSLVTDETICWTDIRVYAEPVNDEGIGVIEAPRGTLFHHYWVDKAGRILKANLIVATGNNNLAMNKAVNDVAHQYIKNGHVTEGILNRVEVAIRCYDPCLSCSSHALGQMPLEITVKDPDGKVRQVIRS
jgi:NAD-reducing hydrogenase large subunit